MTVEIRGDAPAVVAELFGEQAVQIDGGWMLPHEDPWSTFQIVKAWQKSFSDAGLTLFAGYIDEEHAGLFALVDCGPIEIVARARVGTHNAPKPERALARISDFIRWLTDVVPVRVMAADPAGLLAELDEQVDPGTADEIVTRLVKVAPESFGPIVDELEQHGITFERLMSARLEELERRGIPVDSLSASERHDIFNVAMRAYICQLRRVRIWLD